MTPGTVNIFFRGGPIDGRTTRIDIDLIDAGRTINVLWHQYRVVDGPVLKAMKTYPKTEVAERTSSLCATAEYVE